MPVNLTPADLAAIERSLSAPRSGRYLAEKGGDHAGALALHDWNARVSAALLHPLHSQPRWVLQRGSRTNRRASFPSSRAPRT